MNPLIHSKTPRGLRPLIALAVVCLGLSRSDSVAQKVEVDERQSQPLINIGSGKCFAPTPQQQGGPTDWAGLPIQQRSCSDRGGSIEGASQQYWFQSQGHVAFNDQGWFPCWGCIPAGSTGYLIRNLYTNLCLDARDGARTNGSVVQQWTCRDRTARSMVWYVEPGVFPNTFKVRNFNSDLCLDVRGGSSEEYTQLQQYRCTSNNLAQNFSQKFPAGPVVDLNGRWTDGSTRNAVISGGFAAIVIDMSAFNRPAARGRFVSLSTIEVNFPDDATFTGEVSRRFTDEGTQTRITWSNGSVWTKKP